MRESYDERRRYVLHRLAEMGLPCFEPKGAFYLFPDIRQFKMSSDDFCLKLLNEKKVVVVPGNAFGESGEGFIRISYAYSIDNLKVALNRLSEFIVELKK
jgi:aminotransferase